MLVLFYSLRLNSIRYVASLDWPAISSGEKVEEEEKKSEKKSLPVVGVIENSDNSGAQFVCDKTTTSSKIEKITFTLGFSGSSGLLWWP